VSIQKVIQEGRARDMWAPGQANNLAPFHKLITFPALDRAVRTLFVGASLNWG